MPEFNLDPNAASSFQDQLAMLRQGLPPAVTANLPPIPGQPVEQLPPPSPLPEPQAAAAPYTPTAPVGESGPALAARLSAELKYAQENNVSLMEARRSLQGGVNPYANVPPGTFGATNLMQSAGGATAPSPASPAATLPGAGMVAGMTGGNPNDLTQEAAIAPDQMSMQPAPNGNYPSEAAPAPAPVPHTVGKPGDPTLDGIRAKIALVPEKVLKMLESQLHNIQGPDLVGPDVFKSGRGGILGTGIEPIDVLFMALAMGATANLPQAQAQANAFEIMGWPSKYKDNQRKSSQEYIKSQLDAYKVISEQQKADTTIPHLQENALVPDGQGGFKYALPPEKRNTNKLSYETLAKLYPHLPHDQLQTLSTMSEVQQERALDHIRENLAAQALKARQKTTDNGRLTYEQLLTLYPKMPKDQLLTIAAMPEKAQQQHIDNIRAQAAMDKPDKNSDITPKETYKNAKAQLEAMAGSTKYGFSDKDAAKLKQELETQANQLGYTIQTVKRGTFGWTINIAPVAPSKRGGGTGAALTPEQAKAQKMKTLGYD